MTRWWLLVLSALFLLTGCDGGDPGADAGAADGAPPTVDAGEEVTTLEDYMRDHDVVTLETQPDGTEFGQAVTDAEGIAHFYSPTTQGIFRIGADDEAGDHLAGREVTVALGSTSIAYLITDPLGAFQPFLNMVELPEEDAELEVDAGAVYREQAGIEDYDPASGPNPFAQVPVPGVGGAQQSLVIVGVLIQVGIRNILKGILIGAVSTVFANLVESACNLVDPLYAERCRLIGNIAGAAIGLVGGFFTGGVTGWELGATILDTALTAADMNCDRLGGAAVGYTLDPADESGEQRYREVAQKLNYLLHVMETDPQPGQPSWDWALEQSQRVLAVRDVVRADYFQLWNPGAAEDGITNGLGMGLAKSATTGFYNNLEVDVRAAVLRRLTISEGMQAALEIGPYDVTYTEVHWRYVQADWETFRWSYDPGSELAQSLRGLLVGCAFNFVSGVIGEYSDGVAMRAIDETTATFVNGMLDVIEAGIEETYRAHWGGDIPMGMCTADLQEPNGTWELAAASPVPGDLVAGGVAELMDLNLCSATGDSGDDDDWYAYNVAPIELNVQSRLMAVDGGDGQDQRLCQEIYFYSEIYELTGDPPDLVESTCGVVGDSPSTTRFSIRRTLGESWSMLLVRVFHEDGSATTPVDYGLRFTP